MSESPEVKKTELNAQVAGLEKWAYDTFSTKNPAKLPEGVRSWLAKNSWWLAGVGGVVTLLGAVQMWNVAHWTSSLGEFYSAIGYTSNIGLWWYLLLIVTIIEGVALLIAAPKLKNMKLSGWRLLFYLSLLGIVIGIISLLTPGYGLSYLIGVVIGVAIGWTILMQIRDKFSK